MVGLIAVVFAGLIRNLAADVLLIAAVVVCGLVGIIEPAEVFVGFSNSGMLTVAALFVVAAALRETGALNILGAFLLGDAKTERAVLTRMAGAVTGMSAFLNNTPIVAMFIPIVNTWCKNHKVAPSRLLIPLSYLSIFGGTCTLIGTSTNLVVNGLMIERFKGNPEAFGTLHPMALFELSYVGVPYAFAGIVYLLFVGRHLLPSREGVLTQFGEKPREYLVDMQIQHGCRLIGKTVEDAGLRHLPGLFLIEIIRDGESITPVRPDRILREGDLLTFTGVVDTIVDLEHIPGLIAVSEEPSTKRRECMLCEAVVSSTSPAIGKTIRDSDFRALYNAAVIAVNRGGERLAGRVGDIVLRNGDTLLLQTTPHFVRAHRNNPDFYLVSGVEDSRPVRHDKAVLSLVLLGLLVALMAWDAVPIVLAAFFVAGLMIATRCISTSDARQSLDMQTLLTICAAFGLGKALENSGLVSIVAGAVSASLGPWGPVAILAGVFFTTSMFTSIITNNAAAALMFPFAVTIAVDLGVDPRPFCMMVAFAASASFVTPLGYQTNLMVFGPGGYRVTDFMRVGLPLNIIMLIVATLLVPLVWPF
ncbi:MAG TPA: SLC13 family permease [Candidatus Hydrogenedentes bacterium]|nr:SLC13 family permease [Candidatus Hydrogenedentota bacterium]HPG65393.1 SLC13 family permease [Candidatus Hydrogenedentota bacterium]